MQRHNTLNKDELVCVRNVLTTLEREVLLGHGRYEPTKESADVLQKNQTLADKLIVFLAVYLNLSVTRPLLSRRRSGTS